MIVYTIYEPPHPPADRSDHAISLVFIKDGFSWLAAAMAPIWMLLHSLWLVLAIYCVVIAGVDLGLTYIGTNKIIVMFVMMAISVVIGLGE